MKIIYYSPHPTHDIVSEVGYATHQREVIHALSSLGHEVLPIIMGGTEPSNLSPLAQPDYKPNTWKKLIKGMIPRVLWTSFNNFKLLRHDLKAGSKLESAIKAFQPDLIYERSEYLQDSGAKMASKYKIKYILEVNAPFVEEMRSFEGYSLYEQKAHKVEKYKLKQANKVIVVSSSLGEFLVSRYHCDASKLFVQPNCINPQKVHLNLDKLEAVKQSLGISSNDCVVGFVGSMFPYHGVDLLIDAFSKVQAKFPFCKLLIVGDGVILNDLKSQASNLGITEKVLFTGKIPHQNVFEYIAVMNICIMAKSNWYGSPVKLFEYGLMKKPIVAPKTKPVTDVMVDGLDALIIEDKVDNLKNAIEYLIENRENADKIAHSFHQKVLTNYTWEMAAKNIIKLCE